MPSNWVKTPKEKEAWEKAKEIVSEQRDLDPEDFEDQDWGLVSHITKNIVKSSVQRSAIAYKLARVQRSLSAKAAKKDDQSLPEGEREVLAALKRIMGAGGQLISKIRKTREIPRGEKGVARLAERLEGVADTLEDLLQDMD